MEKASHLPSGERPPHPFSDSILCSPMLSPPFLKIGRAAGPATLIMLLGSNSNPNSRLLQATRTSVGEALASHPSSMGGSPAFHPKPPPALQASSPMRVLCPTRASGSGSSAAAFAPEQNPSDPTLVVVSFYRFADFPDHANLRKPLKDLCEELRVSGGIILAPEGINGSICGTRESVEKVLEFIQTDNRLKGLRMVESPVSPEDEAIHHGHTSHSPVGAGEDAPFRWDHVRVKLKREIVTFGDPSVSPIKRVGTYVNPKDWNALIRDPDTMVIDVRNAYETRIGKFQGAVDPCTTAFREFPAWVDDQFQLGESNGQHSVQDFEGIDVIKNKSGLKDQKKLPRIAMYCTGGIRCEKASSFLLSKGFKEVYHLEGGILKYLEEVPKTESLWEGECFVFDKRVSVEHGLIQGNFKLCYGCKQPVSDEDMDSPYWEYGVSCPYCFASKTEEEKERARARHRQFETWGVIGGPDKGRLNPTKADDGKERKMNQLPKSI